MGGWGWSGGLVQAVVTASRARAAAAATGEKEWIIFDRFLGETNGLLKTEDAESGTGRGDIDSDEEGIQALLNTPPLC